MLEKVNSKEIHRVLGWDETSTAVTLSAKVPPWLPSGKKCKLFNYVLDKYVNNQFSFTAATGLLSSF